MLASLNQLLSIWRRLVISKQLTLKKDHLILKKIEPKQLKIWINQDLKAKKLKILLTLLLAQPFSKLL